MGRPENLTSEDFHAFANVTQRILWQGVVAVRRARSSIADSTRSCEPVLSPAARRREGTSPLPTCARRGLRKENRAMATDDADDLVPFQEVRVIRSTAPALLCRIGEKSVWRPPGFVWMT